MPLLQKFIEKPSKVNRLATTPMAKIIKTGTTSSDLVHPKSKQQLMHHAQQMHHADR
jgi:hypothetical protein